MSGFVSCSPRRQRGFSLVELMIALTIGLIISLALATMFSQVSVTNKEQFKAALQIENGRYAMDLLSTDLRLAGYYGDYAALPTGPSALPDPCDIPDQGSTVSSTGSLAFYVQGYPAASLTDQAAIPSDCQTWIDSATLKPGSDILVVRRLDTVPLVNPSATTSPTTSATAQEGAAYVQTTESVLSIQYGSGGTIDRWTDATGTADVVSTSGAATGPALTRRDFNPTGGCTPSATATVCPLAAAYIRKLHVDIYFVSNCRKGSGSNGKCTSSDDTIPTLKRLELTVDASASPKEPTFTMVALAEGIEFLKVYYGVDTNGDGQVDTGGLPQPATVAAWQNVVQAELRLLAVNSESSSSFVDTNSYDLGRDASGNALSYTPSGNSAKFRRHAFDQQVYIINVAGRREK
ncbi:MAG TPA: PilW family protein [Rhodocyclaceae bacterium]|nr:PilW family protein [Rhodocyclaceae bacterium]